jgi:hypothetical protein
MPVHPIGVHFRSLEVYQHFCPYIQIIHEPHFYTLPSQNCTTAHFPLHVHFLAPESPPPPSVRLSSSSLPGGKPTTTSALQVRRANDLIDDLEPSGPIAVLKGVVGSHVPCDLLSAYTLDDNYRSMHTSPVNFR